MSVGITAVAPSAEDGVLREALDGPARDRGGRRRISRELARGATAGVLVFGAGVLVRTASELVFARAMGPAEFGTYSYLFAWLSIIAVAAGLGLPYAFVRFIPEYEVAGSRGRQRRLARYARVVAVSFGLALGALGAALILAVRPTGVGPAAIALGMAGVPALTLLTVQSELARGFRRIVLAYLPILVLRPLLTVAVGVALLVGLGHLTAAQGLGAGLVATLVCLVGSRTRVRRLLVADSEQASTPPVPSRSAAAGRAERRDWLHVALPLLVINVLAAVALRADVIVVGISQGAQAAGVYAVAARVALLATFALEALNTIVAPTISRRFYAGEQEALQRLVRGAARVTFGAALATTLLLELAGTHSLSLFGAGYAGGLAALQILLVGQLVNASTGPVTYLMIATGGQNPAALAQAVSTGLFFLLAVPLTAAWGFLGTAVAVTVARSTINIWMLVAAQRRLRIRAFVL